VPDHPLEPIFHPRAVALVGVSSRQQGMSSGFLTSLIEQDFQEEHGLYPVNPKMTEVAGVPCYPSLLDTPDPVDHVISLVPAPAVPGLVDQCIEKGIRSIHLFTAGFSETGDPELAAMERDFVARLTGAGIRVIGPNCMGLYVPKEGLAFMGGFPSEPGNVMLISQSGANAGDVIHGLSRRGVRFSKAISYGNGADLQSHDFFDYAADDPDTEVVTAYVEGVKDGRRFFEAVQRCAERKPVIILKGGLTGAGARAASSHTGSLAGSREIFEALCRQAGAIRAETMDELHDLVVAVTTSTRNVVGTGVGLVGGGGGIAVLSADAIAAEGLDVPPMPGATKERLREYIPIAGTSINNPIDTNAGADAFLPTLRLVAAADPIDVVFTSPSFGRFGPGPSGDDDADELPAEERRARRREQAERGADELAELQEETGVPFVGLLRSRGGPDDLMDEFTTAAYARGIGVYPSIHRAARAVALIRRWRARREGLPGIF
jgi:acyl-CoA synthetase (NDP forming)